MAAAVRLRVTIVALLFVSSSACGGEEGAQLLVDIRTDLLPGREFESVQTLVWSGDMMRDLGNVTLAADRNADYGAGARVAELSGLPEGAIAMRVALLDGAGDVVLSRRIRLELEGRRGVTVVFTRSCVAYECPAMGDDPGETECLGGRCVTPECTGSESACGEGTCRADGDCEGSVGCAIALCVDGACLSVPDDTICGTETYCHPTRGCIADGGDAGPPVDAGSRFDAGPPVDAGGPGCPGGCDDGDPCTDDTCVDGACVHSPNTAPCDDGIFCNGPDSCADGLCATHPGDPCSGSSVCDETTDTCTGCLGDGDCPADSYGAWTGCGAFSDTCDTTGMRSRGVTTWSCESGTCTPATSTETGSCSRTTDGVGCGMRTYGAWGACGSFSSTCDETGTRSRTVTDYFCASGTCAPSMSTEDGSCTRITDGTTCDTTMYGTWGACGGYSSVCDETGTRSRSVTTYACSDGSCGSSTGSESEGCGRDTDGTDCMLGFEFPCWVTRCSAGTCMNLGDSCGTGICCEFGCQPMGTLCP